MMCAAAHVAPNVIAAKAASAVPIRFFIVTPYSCVRKLRPGSRPERPCLAVNHANGDAACCRCVDDGGPDRRPEIALDPELVSVAFAAFRLAGRRRAKPFLECGPDLAVLLA